MSTQINSVNYRFNPDKKTQSLCEQICREIDGNGLALTDIEAISARSFDVTITSNLIWKVEVSLKSKTLADRQTKNIKQHKTANEAQLEAKKQGQYILKNALGKIELVNNINEDPLHYLKHSTVKLNGGPGHAYITHCSQQCDHGELVCPRCKGKGTYKAVTKKDDLLGTSNNIAANNFCPQCKGRSTIDCPTCAGSGQQTHLYQIHVNASRQNKDTIEADTAVRTSIETFISHTSYKDLLGKFISPVVSELKDIDDKHCSVSYKSKTKAVLLKLSVSGTEYDIIGFGDQNICISKPQILDQTMLPAIRQILGYSPALNSTRKCLKLKSMPLLSDLVVAENTDNIASLLFKKSQGLLSEMAAQQITEQLADIKKHLTPRYSLSAWLPITFIGLLSGIYSGLASLQLTETAIIIAIHVFSVTALGYFISSNLTRLRRKKLKQKNNTPMNERIPALVATLVIIASILGPKLFSIDQRWSLYFTANQYYRQLNPLQLAHNETISNPNLIMLAQRNLIILGYEKVQANGQFDVDTEIAVKDFQKKLGITNTKYLDRTTMALLSQYSITKNAVF